MEICSTLNVIEILSPVSMVYCPNRIRVCCYNYVCETITLINVFGNSFLPLVYSLFKRSLTIADMTAFFVGMMCWTLKRTQQFHPKAVTTGSSSHLNNWLVAIYFVVIFCHHYLIYRQYFVVSRDVVYFIVLLCFYYCDISREHHRQYQIKCSLFQRQIV